jgi:hypothetical protein
MCAPGRLAGLLCGRVVSSTACVKDATAQEAFLKPAERRIRRSVRIECHVDAVKGTVRPRAGSSKWLAQLQACCALSLQHRLVLQVIDSPQILQTNGVTS